MTNTLSDRSVLVVGATRGLGRGVAEALASTSARVIAIGRDPKALETLRQEGGDRLDAVRGDASDPTFIAQTIDAQEPTDIVMVAGATPLMRPLSEYDWESLSKPWQVDVKLAFHWLQAALRLPLSGRFVLFSSGAALHGSPLSGGYAGAKQTQRFLAKYAAGEARARELSLQIRTILPQLSPATDLGRSAARGYAKASGQSFETFVEKRFANGVVTPQLTGAALVELLGEDGGPNHQELILSAAGLQALGEQ
jgi:NAD(P)-dependent dehydrogenase (short-subunit alcohol dehydrogenase family)